MSWSEHYPVFTDEEIDNFEKSSTQAELRELGEWFGIARKVNERTARHRVAVSLFWKNLSADEGELKVTSRDQMKKAAELGLVGRYPPWEHYVEPLLAGAAILNAERPEVVLRIYLAADLKFLVEDFVALNCEVFLMRSPSLRHSPGALWRFLALENPDEWITIIDADRGRMILADVERSEHTMRAGLGMWRIPYFFDGKRHQGDLGYYRPINACQFGAKGGLPMKQLMKAFIWHSQRETLETNWRESGGQDAQKPQHMATTIWPSYGFDEWFLLAAFYPRMAFAGITTFYHWGRPNVSYCHLIDIEYVTWANPKSEVFRCPPPRKTTYVWDSYQPEMKLKVREDTKVIVRERCRRGASQAIFWRPPPQELKDFPQFQENLPELLRFVSEDFTSAYWVDLNPNLELSKKSAELFLDRRYTNADLVVCGSCYLRVSKEVGVWAKAAGLEENYWQTDGVLQVPKLEGPMTLWRTEFSKEFFQAWKASRIPIDPKILMRAWIDQGKVSYFRTTARQMGWKVR